MVYWMITFDVELPKPKFRHISFQRHSVWCRLRSLVAMVNCAVLKCLDLFLSYIHALNAFRFNSVFFVFVCFFPPKCIYYNSPLFPLEIISVSVTFLWLEEHPKEKKMQTLMIIHKKTTNKVVLSSFPLYLSNKSYLMGSIYLATDWNAFKLFYWLISPTYW